MDNYILESKKLIWCFVKFEKSLKRVKSTTFDRILHEIYIIKSKMFFGH